jgi:hypothetical protein
MGNTQQKNWPIRTREHMFVPIFAVMTASDLRKGFDSKPCDLHARVPREFKPNLLTLKIHGALD